MLSLQEQSGQALKALRDIQASSFEVEDFIDPNDDVANFTFNMCSSTSSCSSSCCSSSSS